MIVNLLLVILVIVRLVIGVRLFVTGRKNNLPNLIWLSSNMIFGAIGLLFAPTEGNPLANYPFSIWIFFLAVSFLTAFPIIVFNQLTFYKGRKSPAIWFWILSTFCFALASYGVMISKSNYDESPWVAMYIPGVILVWAWHGWLAHQAYQKMALQPSVEYWVKVRYRLITVYSIVLMIGAAVSVVRIVFAGGGAVSAIGSLTGLITLLAQITSVTLLFLVWVMPEGFRIWINQSHQTLMEEQAYEQALAVLNIIGTAMSDDTKLPKTLAIVAIRKTIGHEINTEDSKKIEMHVRKLGYDEWYNFLSNRHLYTFLKEVANVNPDGVIARAKYTLRENQSLFTLQTK